MASSIDLDISFQAYMSSYSASIGNPRILSTHDNDSTPNVASQRSLAVEFALLLESLGVPGPCTFLGINETTRFIGAGAQFSVRAGEVVFDEEFDDAGSPDFFTAAAKMPKFLLSNEVPLDLSDPEASRQLRHVVLEVMALDHDCLRGHPNIVELVGWGFDSSNWHAPPVLILELADCDLGTALRDGHISGEEQRVELLSGIASGLDAIHAVGLVHGDLKPENVLVFRHGDEWVAKLSDFAGGASSFRGAGLAGRGTVGWRAPELRQYHEQGAELSEAYLGAIDVYAYGLMSWAIFCGYVDAPPYSEDSMSSKIARDDLEKHRNTISSSLFKSIVHIIPAMMSQNAEERPRKLSNCFHETQLTPINGILETVIDGSSDEGWDEEPQSSPVYLLNYATDDWMLPELHFTSHILISNFTKDATSLPPKVLFSTFLKAMEGPAVMHDPPSLEIAFKLLRASVDAGVPAARAMVFILHEFARRRVDDVLLENRREWEFEAASNGAFFLLRRLPVTDPSLADQAFTLFQATGGFNKFYYDVSAETVSKILENPHQLPERAANGDTLVHVLSSCRKQSYLEQLRLIVTPDNVNALNSEGETPLYRACTCGATETVMFLLSQGADPSIRINDKTPTCLHWLIAFHPHDINKITTALIEHSAELYAICLTQYNLPHYPFVTPLGTPLHWAVAFSSVEAVMALLSLGADPLVRDGVWPLSFSHEFPKARPSTDFEVVFTNCGEIPICGSKGGSTSVDMAIKNLDFEILHKLLFGENGCFARLHGLDDSAPGPYHTLMMGRWRWIFPTKRFYDPYVMGTPDELDRNLRSTIQLLKKAGFDINATSSWNPSRAKCTALMLAAEKGYLDVCQALLDFGADVNMLDSQGANALRYGKPIPSAFPSRGPYLSMRDSNKKLQDELQLRIAQLLLKHGVRVDVRDQSGKTALLYKARYSTLDLVSLLLDSGASPYGISMQEKRNVFAVAIESSRPDNHHLGPWLKRHLCPLLETPNHNRISHHAVNQAHVNGKTLLYCAANSGQEEAASLLINLGADVNSIWTHRRARDGYVDFRTPLDGAIGAAKWVPTQKELSPTEINQLWEMFKNIIRLLRRSGGLTSAELHCPILHNERLGVDNTTPHYLRLLSFLDDLPGPLESPASGLVK